MSNVFSLLFRTLYLKAKLNRINKQLEAEKVQKTDRPIPQPRAERPSKTRKP